MTSPDGTKIGPPSVQTVTDAYGVVWSISYPAGWVLRDIGDGKGPLATTGHGTNVLWRNAFIWVLSPKSPFHWWKWVGDVTPKNPWQDTGSTNEPTVITPPPPPPTPLSPSAKYRNGQPYLFQTLRAAQEPNRVTGGSPLGLEFDAILVGPTSGYISRSSGWAWDKQGGDFIDAARTRNSATPVPWFSVVTDAVSGNSASHIYAGVDVTSALQFVQSNNRWNALLITCHNAPRVMAGKFSANPPKIDVTYTDSTTAVLACRLVGSATSNYPATTAAEISLPAFLEFDKPTKQVQSAALTFTITQHWSGANPVTGGLVLDPSLNTDQVAQGLAANYSLDAGMNADPSVIGLQSYVDGSNLDEFVHRVLFNTGSEDSFDPAIYGNGPTNLTKLPHVGLGKWIAANTDPSSVDSSCWSLVQSTYAGEGFSPLAPGIGAMKILMRGNPTLTDGSVVGYAIGYNTTDAYIYLPESLWGITELFVRYYVRLGTPNGSPYRMPIAKKYQVHKQAGDAPVWTDTGGKFGIMPGHPTSYGGVSGTSGGGYGWQMRNAWSDIIHDETGPDLGGITFGMHTFDYNINNPVGFRYGATDTPKDSGCGQRGGLGGNLYAENWYCIEGEMKLNTVQDAVPGYVADGELRVWIDGRKTLERVGMVFRSRPLYNPGYVSGQLRPIRDLGHRSLWFNWFHGGLTQNTVDRVAFISQLAYGTSYIGPMKKGKSVPTQPTNVQASDGTSPNKVTVTCDSSLPTIKYDFYRSSVAGQRGVWVGTSIGTPSFDDTPPDATHYFYTVVASNDVGPSADSAQDEGYLASAPPPPPPPPPPPQTGWPFTIPAPGTRALIGGNTFQDVGCDLSQEVIGDSWGNSVDAMQWYLPKVLSSWGSSAISLVKDAAGTLTDVIIWISGGGHGDVGWDGLGCWRASTGLFSMLVKPSHWTPRPCTDTAHGETIPGRPESYHAYQAPWGLDSDEGATGAAFLVVAPYAVGQGAQSSGWVHQFQLNSSAWSRFGGNASVPDYPYGGANAIIKDTFRKLLVRYPSNNGDAYSTLDYTAPNRTWSNLLATTGSRASNGWGDTYEACGCYDDARDWYIAGLWHGGNGLMMVPGNTPGAAWTQFVETGTKPTSLWGMAIEHRNAPGHDEFVMIDATQLYATGAVTDLFVGTVTATSPPTINWTKRTITGPPSNLRAPFPNGELFNRVKYVKPWDALLVVPAVNSKMEIWAL